MFMYSLLTALNQIKNYYYNEIKADPIIIKIVDNLIFFNNGDVWHVLCNGSCEQFDAKTAQDTIKIYNISWLIKV